MRSIILGLFQCDKYNIGSLFSFFLNFLSWVLKILNEIRFKGIRIFLGLFCFLKSFSFSLSVSLIWALFRG